MLSKYRFVAIYVLLGLQTLAVAGNASEQAFKVHQLYEALQFEKAVALSRSLLKSDYSFTREELITIHQYAGYAFFNLGRADSARSHFLSLLSIKPDYRLDPVNTSPKIIRFFNTIKKDFLQQRLNASGAAYVKYVFIEDPRPGAGWRSAVLPGWGQYYKKQPLRGKIYAAGFASAAVSALTALVLEKHYHDRYLGSTVPAAIKDNYDAYNFWYKTRRLSLYLSAAVWSVSVADALWLPYDSTKWTVSYKDGPTLSLQINF